MDHDEDLKIEHQTDEVKSILNQIGELNNEKVKLNKRLIEIDEFVLVLQSQLMKEKKRTSSVSDNIKVF
jgi:predicted  nucleic acid-binding Zn-ribbon protein